METVHPGRCLKYTNPRKSSASLSGTGHTSRTLPGEQKKTTVSLGLPAIGEPINAFTQAHSSVRMKKTEPSPHQNYRTAETKGNRKKHKFLGLTMTFKIRNNTYAGLLCTEQRNFPPWQSNTNKNKGLVATFRRRWEGEPRSSQAGHRARAD